MGPRTRLLGACALAALAAMAVHGLLFAGAESQDRAGGAPEIKHVFVVVVENENAASTFGPASEAPYLANTLRSRGAYLPNYYATGHLSLDNYISMVSGQAPNVQTQADCPIFTDFVPGAAVADGQVLGTGCVYPAGTTQTVANLLEDHGYTWKGYMEDMAAKAPAEPATCRHPGLGAPDNTQSAEVGDQYATRHNPFMYFHSIIDFPTCNQNVVDYSRLDGDLVSAERTPNYSFITPNLCHDGHDDPCVDGSRGGLFAANKWLSEEIPKILASPAFNDNGLLIVTFDEAEGSPPDGDASACCNEPPGPNTPNPGGPVVGPGGGKVGAVLLSPCIAPGTTDATPYNHYSMLRSVEDYFGLPYLGYSGQNGLASFGSQVFTQSSCGGSAGGGGASGGGGSAGGGASGGGGAASNGGGDCAKQLIGSRRSDLLQGSADGENLLGKRGGDRIAGNGGPDCLRGGGGRDRLNGGPGIDQFSGGKGRDRIMAVDGVAEAVSCGPGRDRAVLDPGDRATGCEKRRVAR